MRITREDFVGALAGEHDLVASVANGAAEEKLGDAVGIGAEGFGLQDGGSEVVGEVILRDGDGIELGAGLGGHLFCLRLFVVVGAIKGESEGVDGLGMMLCGETQNGTGVETAGQVAANGNIRAKAKANGLFEHMAKLGGILCVGARRDFTRALVVEVPVLIELNMVLGGEEVVTGRDLEDAVIKSSTLIVASLHDV